MVALALLEPISGPEKRPEGTNVESERRLGTSHDNPGRWWL